MRRTPKGKRSIVEKCRLCGVYGRLVNSHIIPHFFLKNTRKQGEPVLRLDDSGQRQKGQDWPKEYLLCKTCEQKFSTLETYVRQLYYNKERGALQRQRETTFGLEFINIDYKKLKLFQLSVLWRASVSTLEEFSCVALGQGKEKIREMLLFGDPGPREMYPCAMMLMRFPEFGGGTGDLMIPPSVVTLNGYPVYVFVFGSTIWHFVATESPNSCTLAKYYVQEDGSMKLRLLRNIREHRIILDFFLSVGTAQQ